MFFFQGCPPSRDSLMVELPLWAATSGFSLFLKLLSFFWPSKKTLLESKYEKLFKRHVHRNILFCICFQDFICVCTFVHISSTCLWIPDPQELEAFVRLPKWILGMDLTTRGVVVNLPHHWAISPALQFSFKLKPSALKSRITVIQTSH